MWNVEFVISFMFQFVCPVCSEVYWVSSCIWPWPCPQFFITFEQLNKNFWWEKTIKSSFSSACVCDSLAKSCWRYPKQHFSCSISPLCWGWHFIQSSIIPLKITEYMRTYCKLRSIYFSPELFATFGWGRGKLVLFVMARLPPSPLITFNSLIQQLNRKYINCCDWHFASSLFTLSTVIEADDISRQYYITKILIAYYLSLHEAV